MLLKAVTICIDNRLAGSDKRRASFGFIDLLNGFPNLMDGLNFLKGILVANDTR